VTARCAGGRGALTGQWRHATELEVTRLSQEVQAAESAERAAADARRQAVGLLLPPPPVLAEEPPPGVDPGPVRAAWKTWAQPPNDGTPTTAAVLRSLADHLDQAVAPLMQELRSLSAQATAQYSEREGTGDAGVGILVLCRDRVHLLPSGPRMGWMGRPRGRSGRARSGRSTAGRVG
jgi:hypothetical protein